jgi:hypothetical protein
MTGCDWVVSTGKPEGRQDWADTHLALVELLAEHLRLVHAATGEPGCGYAAEAMTIPAHR